MIGVRGNAYVTKGEGVLCVDGVRIDRDML